MAMVCKTHRRWIGQHLQGFAIAAVLATSLASCGGSINDRTWAGAFTSPGKFEIFTCDDLERYVLSNRARMTELEQLMSRASQGAGGEFVNTIAYRGEYAQARGEMAEMTKAKADKQCAVNNKFSSGRAVF